MPHEGTKSMTYRYFHCVYVTVRVWEMNEGASCVSLSEKLSTRNLSEASIFKDDKP